MKEKKRQIQNHKPTLDIFENPYWSLYRGDVSLEPLKFSNGKTQEDVVKEILEKTKEYKVIFLHGTCGSGKSAIALNVARALGKASIVVPVKALQRQYEEDYIKDKYLKKTNGKKMKISMITGKDNHDSVFIPGKSCASLELPENIKLVDKNLDRIREYVRDNPFMDHHRGISMNNLRRAAVAGANPYWSPILPSSFELKTLTDARKRRYKGVSGETFVFYHRKPGCSYYDQYEAYLDADAMIFNSAKYRTEMVMGRKPLTEVDIIDEADEFLDQFFQQDELNLTRLLSNIKTIHPESPKAQRSLDKIKRLIELELQNKKAIGVDKNAVLHVKDTKIKDVLEEFTSNDELEAEISIDEMNYANNALEVARDFKHTMKKLYLTYRKEKKEDSNEENIIVKLVSTDISGKFQDLLDKTKTLIFMSGTLHSDSIIKNIFKIENFAKVIAEDLNFGSTEIIMTGKEFDCRYSTFKSGEKERVDYLDALSASIKAAEIPALIHVTAYKDLPTEKEKELFDLDHITSVEEIKIAQGEDKTGKAVSDFKQGVQKKLFSTKCSRGVDFPGKICRSIIFTKYPNPNVSDTFWKVLQKTHKDYYWEFYRDKAWREFLQRIYRALRSPNDHVYILSPDIRVLDAVRKLQRKER